MSVGRDALPATLRTVAEAAGVSIATVSNVLNHPERVAPATHRTVLEQLGRLGYIPSDAARSLQHQGAANVGLIVPDLMNGLFLDAARGAQAEAPRLGLEVLLANSGRSWSESSSNGPRQSSLIEAFASARVRALVVGAMEDPAADLERVRRYVDAVVVLNHRHPTPDWCTVLMDDESIGRIAVEHLAAIGVDALCFVAPPDVAQPIERRRRGVRTAAAAAGLRLQEVPVPDVLADDGDGAAAEVLDARGPEGRRLGVLCVSDELALGVLRAIRDAGDVVVPDDVAVVGMDAHHRTAPSDWAPLTSFAPPGLEMGRTAVRLVRDELDALPTRPHQHRQVVVPAVLTPRRSTVGPAVR